MLGGTHVMYALHHTDTSEPYAGLPWDPRIGPVVRGWTEWLKPVAVVATLAAVAGMITPFIRVGPTVVEDDDGRGGDAGHPKAPPADVVSHPCRKAS
ncbi:formate dehydrogenase N subunit beta transmembrane domain-containing protein [Xanthobacter sp. V4C-4]|uniref:formate dehydrogenase N subunit beta transmembrane domain-containing protein n=1 Tax=Xanthobacter cornucopiae TaxID=3119924 RepID=UPI003729D7AB